MLNIDNSYKLIISFNGLMYEKEIKEIEEKGFKGGISSLLYNSTLDSILEGDYNEHELKKALVPKLEKILKESKEYHEENLELAGMVEYFTEDLDNFISENKSYLDSIETAIKRYGQGKSIKINGLKFCNADKGPIDKINYKMFPKLSFVGNALFYAGFVPYTLGFPIYLISGNSTLVGTGITLICTGFGLKFINKSMKALYKKQPIKTLYNSILGFGGASIADPSLSLLSLPFNYSPLLFNIHLFYKFFKFISSREKIKDKLPSMKEITKDFETQVKKYNGVKDKYKNVNIKEIPLTEKDFIEEIKDVNKYLKHHLKNIKLKDIDIDIDNLIGIIIGAAARADPFTSTAEFCTLRYKDKEDKIDLTTGLFAKIYSHEVMHLDGIMNEGRANYLAGKILEELAIYRPNQGYDLELEKGKFDAVGHVYTILKLGELKKKGIISKFPKKSIKKDVIKYVYTLLNDEVTRIVKRVKHKKPIRKYIKELKEKRKEERKKFKELLGKHLVNDLKKKGVKDKKDLGTILRWLYPGLVRKGLFRMQSIIGGSNPKGGYTVDHYKLMKRDTTFV